MNTSKPNKILKEVKCSVPKLKLEDIIEALST